MTDKFTEEEKYRRKAEDFSFKLGILLDFVNDTYKEVLNEAIDFITTSADTNEAKSQKIEILEKEVQQQREQIEGFLKMFGSDIDHEQFLRTKRENVRLNEFMGKLKKMYLDEGEAKQTLEFDNARKQKRILELMNDNATQEKEITMLKAIITDMQKKKEGDKNGHSGTELHFERNKGSDVSS